MLALDRMAEERMVVEDKVAYYKLVFVLSQDMLYHH
jgi:hypothetical protein